MTEEFAAGLLAIAIRRGQAAELLGTLFDGGSVTYDGDADRLVMISQGQLDIVMGRVARVEIVEREGDEA